MTVGLVLTERAVSGVALGHDVGTLAIGQATTTPQLMPDVVEVLLHLIPNVGPRVSLEQLVVILVPSRRHCNDGRGRSDWTHCIQVLAMCKLRTYRSRPVEWKR